MKISVSKKDDSAITSSVLIVPLFEDSTVKDYISLDKSLKGRLKSVFTSKEFSGKPGKTLIVHTNGLIKPDRVLLIGLGKRLDLTRERLRQAGGHSALHLSGINVSDAALSTATISSLDHSPVDFLEGLMLSQYSYNRFKENSNFHKLKNFTILTSQNIGRDIRWTKASVAASFLARDMVNTPSNHLTPSDMVKLAKSLKGVSVKVLEIKDAEKLGMGAFISVTKGSAEPPKFIIINYKGKKTKPIVLIGKSITFDSGGISLKPAPGMEKMKYDMSGGAAVLGVMQALSESGLPLNVTAILPATENMPGGSASKPGDVVKTMDGKTVEIISTDAEGRLVMADAICYAKKMDPSLIVDIATLTGACSIALGNDAIAMMGNDETLMNRMRDASSITSEKVWQMPLFEEYRDYIKSDVADIKNSAGRTGSLVTSGSFLSEFADKTPWLHLDIASTAWTDKDRPYIPKGATGIGVRLLLEFLRNL